jgi:hypothetical protein
MGHHGWRDLSKTQYRLIKGDEQLDQTYHLSSSSHNGSSNSGLHSQMAPPPSVRRLSTLYNPANHKTSSSSSAETGSSGSSISVSTGSRSSSTSSYAHHISNAPLSEISYCIALARRLPVALLTSVVRRQWQPAEYPASLQQLVASTPDEAVPEFYTDPGVSVKEHSQFRE